MEGLRDTSPSYPKAMNPSGSNPPWGCFGINQGVAARGITPVPGGFQRGDFLPFLARMLLATYKRAFTSIFALEKIALG